MSDWRQAEEQDQQEWEAAMEAELIKEEHPSLEDILGKYEYEENR